MMNTVGELVINRTRMVGRVAELEKLVDTLSFSKERLQGKVAEFQENTNSTASVTTAPPRTVEPRANAKDAYERGCGRYVVLVRIQRIGNGPLRRFQYIVAVDGRDFRGRQRVLSQLQGFIGRVEGDIDEFTKLAHHLQDEITAARMVPIGTLYSRLSRAVRDAANSTGKHVELDLSGSETELDNNIIQQISDPLVHLVRNSVAHGIEQSADRAAAGKSSTGNIMLRAYHRGNHIYIEVEDDGGGINYERVKQSAIERGLVSEETPTGLRNAISGRCFSIRVLHCSRKNGTGWAWRRAGRRAGKPECTQRRNRYPEHERQGYEVYAQGAPHPDYFSGPVRALRCDEFRSAFGGRRGNSPTALR